MTIILFVIILGVLVFVHELGHFLLAKLSGIRVDEFGLGFPPKIASFKKGETVYSINIVPFGGFVRIHGENLEEVEEDVDRSFSSKNRWWQAAILVAGVTFNLIFAWALISIGFMIGQPTSVDYVGFGEVKDPEVVVVQTFPESPAFEGGIKIGDVIKGVSANDQELETVSDVSISEFIKNNQDSVIEIEHQRGQELLVTNVTPKEGIIEDQKVIGLSFDMIGTLKLAPHMAILEGLISTIDLTKLVTVELGKFFGNIIIGEGDFSGVAGPVGIVSLVGDASRLGLVHILSFTAIISIHLAIINMVPFPALDGGRLLFVAIEGVTRKTIPPKVFQYVNLIGFAILILLMIVVTYVDISRLF